jgi:hypothetical protein
MGMSLAMIDTFKTPVPFNQSWVASHLIAELLPMMAESFGLLP